MSDQVYMCFTYHKILAFVTINNIITVTKLL